MRLKKIFGVLIIIAAGLWLANKIDQKLARSEAVGLLCNDADKKKLGSPIFLQQPDTYNYGYSLQETKVKSINDVLIWIWVENRSHFNSVPVDTCMDIGSARAIIYDNNGDLILPREPFSGVSFCTMTFTIPVEPQTCSVPLFDEHLLENHEANIELNRSYDLSRGQYSLILTFPHGDKPDVPQHLPPGQGIRFVIEP